MKIQKLRELTREELLHRHDELWSGLFGMKVKHALGQLENPLQLRATRREIARIRTLLRQQGTKEVSRRRRQSGASGKAAARPKAEAAGKAKAPSGAGTKD